MFHYALLRQEPRARNGGLGDPTDRLERLASQDVILKGIWPPPGERQPLVDKLFTDKLPLKEVAERIFQGLVTSADKVYTVDEVTHEAASVIVASRQTGSQHELERNLLKPLLSGPNIQRYSSSQTNRRLLFPYRIEGDRAFLIEPQEFQHLYPKTWTYLCENRAILEGREKGKMHHDRWYAYVYPKNLTLHGRRKLAVPRLVQHLCAFYDAEGQFYLDNVDVGGLLLKEQDHKACCYITGLMNSRLMDYCHSLVSAPFRGGFRSANRQFLERLPIHTIDFTKREEREAYDRIIGLVERMLDLAKRKAESSLAASELSEIERLLTQTDREIDDLVYDLYGLTNEERRLVEEAH